MSKTRLKTRLKTRTQTSKSPGAYAAEVDVPKKDVDKVKAWERKIDSAQGVNGLKFANRIKERKLAKEYMTCNFTKKKRGKTARYLAPMLEDSHRRTIPKIPTPFVESTVSEHDDIDAAITTLLDTIVSSPQAAVQKVIKRLEYDDDYMGVGVGKVIWEHIEVPIPDNDVVYSEEEIALEFDKATAESIDPLTAIISSSDNDGVHLEVHKEQHLMLDDGDIKDRHAQHILDHEANMFLYKDQRAVLKRIKPENYVYDTSVPWEDRAWEAERRSVRITQLIDEGYRNITPDNCKIEANGQINVVWEDATTSIWDIHDRLNDELFVIPSDAGEGKSLRDEEWPVKPNGLPLEIYNLLVFRPLEDGDGYGMAVATMLISLLDALYEVDYRIEVHTKNHSNYKTITRRGALTTGDKGALRDPDQMFVSVGDDAFTNMKEHKPPPIPDTLLVYRGILLQEMRRIVGLDAQDLGVDHSAVISATESSIRGDSSSSKVSDRQEIAGEFIAWVAKTFLSFYKLYGTGGISLRAHGPGGPQDAILDQKNIPDDIDVFFDISSDADVRRSEDINNFMQYTNYIMASGQKSAHREINAHFGKLLNIRRPNKFVDFSVPEGPENVESGMGSSPSPTKQPGVPV